MDNTQKEQHSALKALLCVLALFLCIAIWALKLSGWLGLLPPATAGAAATISTPIEQPPVVIPAPEALSQGDRIPLPVLLPLTDTISLSVIKAKLRVKGELVQDGDLIRAKLAVGGNQQHNLVNFDLHGHNHEAADKLVIGCRRFGADGNEEITEDPTSECGKLYQAVLSIFVDNAQAFTFYLMDEARYNGELGRFSRAAMTGQPLDTTKNPGIAKVTIGKLVFSYDGLLIICRADSYPCPQK